ncbi:SRPBCC family protein [Nocardia higoensis]|uniref:SRPBCC family protein n=1 Tax=Nocardia higoensis TaxID=228599 RepID=UPI0002ECE5E0|nr:SRPBCC family protein [Nocardia higoensis]
MKLENTFTIPVPADQAWPVLLDLERLAPCVPGATITSREGDDYHGRIKVKLGPVGLSYKGIIKVVSQDEAAGVAVLEGSGRENRGNGTAKAVITCRLVESNGVTDVFVDTDLAITGKPAQFGRGALAEVAGTLIGTFADNLAAEITADPSPAVTAESAETPANTALEPTAAQHDTTSSAGEATQPLGAQAAAVRSITPRQGAEPIDIMAAAGLSPNRRLAFTAVAGIAVAVLLTLAFRRRPGRRGARP